MDNKEKLFAKFPPVSTKEWMDKINADLKGADFQKKMVWKSDEEIEINPFYRSEDIEDLAYINIKQGQHPFVKGIKTKNNSWLVRQNIEVSDYSEANNKALSILMKGVDSLGFVLTDPESVGKANFDILLRDINIESIELNFQCNGKAKEILNHLNEIVRERGINSDNIRGAIEVDPIGKLMLNGKLCVTLEEGFDYLTSLTNSANSFANFRTVQVNASVFGNAGADTVKELAFGLSMGNEYMAQMTDRSLDGSLAASKIRFSFGIGSGYFMEIAKLRAARLLWTVITKPYVKVKTDDIQMGIHCVTSEWNLTVYDPFVNMLRTQTEAMSASIGGADSLTVQPFDTAFRKPDEFSERIARNQQLILKEESYFDKVADPAAGSYYVEKLTSLIADKAWRLFLEIEKHGGFIESLKSGYIQGMLSGSAKKKISDVATRKTVLLGTNQYPNTGEKISESVDLMKIMSEKSYEEDLLIEPVKILRASKEYDQLRIAVDRSKQRPVVSLLPLGNILMRKARAQFSTSFFGCGGYNIIDNSGFDTVEEAVASALESKADIAVICSSDEEYILYAPDICSRLKGKVLIVVAGNPANKDELKSLGVESFIHLKSNVPLTLADFNKRLGL